MAYTDNQINDYFQGAVGRTATPYEIDKYRNAPMATMQGVKDLYGKLNTNNSIADYLTYKGADPSYVAREKMAAEQGIQNYQGTAEQNTLLLSGLRNKDTVARQPEQSVPGTVSTQTNTQQNQQTDTPSPYTDTSPQNPTNEPQSKISIAEQSVKSAQSDLQNASDAYRTAQSKVSNIDNQLRSIRQDILQNQGVQGRNISESQINAFIATQHSNLLNMRNQYAQEQSQAGNMLNSARSNYTTSQKQYEFERSEQDKQAQRNLTQSLGEQRIESTTRGQDIRATTQNQALALRSQNQAQSIGLRAQALNLRQMVASQVGKLLPASSQKIIAAEGKGIDQILTQQKRVENISAKMSRYFPRIMDLADEFSGKDYKTINELSALYTREKVNDPLAKDAAAYIEAITTLQNEYGGQQSAIIGSKAGAHFGQVGTKAIPFGLSRAGYEGIKEQIDYNVEAAKQSVNETLKNSMDNIDAQFKNNGGGGTQIQPTNNVQPSDTSFPGSNEL